MKPTTVLGIVLLFLLLAAMFTGLYYAYGSIGKAVERAEEQKNIIPCSKDVPCESGECVEGFCRPAS